MYDIVRMCARIPPPFSAPPGINPLFFLKQESIMNVPFSEFWHLKGQTFLNSMYMPIFSLKDSTKSIDPDLCLAKKSGPVPGPTWSLARNSSPSSKEFALTAFCIQTLRTRDQSATVSCLTGVTASCH